MKYILKFIKHIGFVGWVLYLTKVIILDYMPDRLYDCIWAVVFIMMFYLGGVVENWWENR